MSISLRLCAGPVILTAVLTACGGGGGGGGGSRVSSPVEVPFSAFDAVRPNQTVVMSGISRTARGSGTGVTLDPVDRNNSAARLTFDDAGNLSAFSMSAPNSSVSFGAGGVVDCKGAGCGGSSGTAVGALVNPYAMGWNYQSFGVWMDQISPTTFRAGAMSAGALTPGSAVPTTSSATFTGHASGYYFDGSGGRYASDAHMTALVHFGERRVLLSTTGTGLRDLNAPNDGTPRTPIPRSDLNLSGTLNYAPGVNRFSGDVKTQNAQLTGKADGSFYGPGAQEIGGVYGLSSSTGARMVGGFGGKKQ